jgi:DNA repair protein RadC
MSDSIFDQDERELLNAARLVLHDGARRLKARQSLFTSGKRDARAACRDARVVLTDKLIADYATLRHEVAAAVLLDAQGRLIDIKEFPQGKAAKVEISFRILASWVCNTGAVAVVLCHNHPSGDNTPSQDDVLLTDYLGAWLKMMDCKLLEHLVLSGEGATAIIGGWL